MKVAFFDLFAGAGGAAEGARQAGAKVALSWEFWEAANRVHQDNHPHSKIERREIGADPEADIRRLSWEFNRWRAKGYHIHLHGSPPCQALSNASNRNAAEGMPMVMHFLRLVEECTPDSWSMENVPPMFKHLPDRWKACAQIVNCADYGVPQTRKRCIVGEGWTITPTHLKKPHPKFPHIKPWVTILDTLPHLGELIHPVACPSIVVDSGRGGGPKSGKKSDGTKGGGSGPLFRDISEPCYTVKSGAYRLLALNMDGCGPSRSRRADSADRSVEEPSKTVRNNAPSTRIVNQATKGEATKLRSLTVEETALLQGFPGHYSFASARTQKNRWTMIGNALPPPLMKAIVEGIE